MRLRILHFCHGPADVLIKSGVDAVDHAKMRADFYAKIQPYFNNNSVNSTTTTPNRITKHSSHRNIYCVTIRMRKTDAILIGNFYIVLAAKRPCLDEFFSVFGHGSSLILHL